MRLYRLILDWVPIEKIHAWSDGSDGSEFEASVIESVKKEGFYNPITTDVRERSYRWDPKKHYISLGSHRYWLAMKAGFTHLWCLGKVWNAQREGIDNRAKQFVELETIVCPKKLPPWDIRDLVPRPDIPFTKKCTGEIYQDTAEGNFTGRMLITPDSKVNIGSPTILVMRNGLTSLLE